MSSAYYTGQINRGKLNAIACMKGNQLKQYFISGAYFLKDHRVYRVIITHARVKVTHKLYNGSIYTIVNIDTTVI